MSSRLSGVMVMLCIGLPCFAWAQSACEPREVVTCRLSKGCGGFKICNPKGTGYGVCASNSDSTGGAACTGCGGKAGTVTCNSTGQRLGCMVDLAESCNNCDDNGDGLKDNELGVAQANTLSHKWCSSWT